jgi:hypothetical protein
MFLGGGAVRSLRRRAISRTILAARRQDWHVIAKHNEVAVGQ